MAYVWRKFDGPLHRKSNPVYMVCDQCRIAIAFGVLTQRAEEAVRLHDATEHDGGVG